MNYWLVLALGVALLISIILATSARKLNDQVLKLELQNIDLQFEKNERGEMALLYADRTNRLAKQTIMYHCKLNRSNTIPLQLMALYMESWMVKNKKDMTNFRIHLHAVNTIHANTTGRLVQKLWDRHRASVGDLNADLSDMGDLKYAYIELFDSLTEKWGNVSWTLFKIK